MLRSFSYVSFAALDRFTATKDQAIQNSSDLAAWAQAWQDSASSAYLWAYVDAMNANPSLLSAPTQSQNLLNAYLLEKALYELLYELNNRPTWLHIPMNGILTL